MHAKLHEDSQDIQDSWIFSGHSLQIYRFLLNRSAVKWSIYLSNPNLERPKQIKYICKNLLHLFGTRSYLIGSV